MGKAKFVERVLVCPLDYFFQSTNFENELSLVQRACL